MIEYARGNRPQLRFRGTRQSWRGLLLGGGYQCGVLLSCRVLFSQGFPCGFPRRGALARRRRALGGARGALARDRCRGARGHIGGRLGCLPGGGLANRGGPGLRRPESWLDACRRAWLVDVRCLARRAWLVDFARRVGLVDARWAGRAGRCGPRLSGQGAVRRRWLEQHRRGGLGPSRTLARRSGCRRCRRLGGLLGGSRRREGGPRGAPTRSIGRLSTGRLAGRLLLHIDGA